MNYVLSLIMGCIVCFCSKTINFAYFYALIFINSREKLNQNNNTERFTTENRITKIKNREDKKDFYSNFKMMPHHGRNFEEEMSRFEAEINNARAAAFMAAGGGMAQVPMIAVTSAPTTGNINFTQNSIINRNRPVQISAPPSGAHMIRAPPSNAVISAPPSNAVISAKPTLRTKDDDDILATLMKVEKEIKTEPKQVSYPGFI